MPIHNLIEYSDNYSKTSGSLLFKNVCKDIPAVNNNGEIVEFNGANATDSFNFKAKITGQTGDNGTKQVEIKVRLKYVSNFWRILEMHCELILKLTFKLICKLCYSLY